MPELSYGLAGDLLDQPMPAAYDEVGALVASFMLAFSSFDWRCHVNRRVHTPGLEQGGARGTRRTRPAPGAQYVGQSVAHMLEKSSPRRGGGANLSTARQARGRGKDGNT